MGRRGLEGEMTMEGRDEPDEGLGERGLEGDGVSEGERQGIGNGTEK